MGLDVAEAERLFEVISGERLEALYVLALMTGLRRGELLALRWDDIAVTKDMYGHLLEGDKRAAAESMTRALFGG